MKEINANILEGKYEDILAAVQSPVITLTELPESVKFILFCNQLSKQNWLSIALIAVFFQFPH